MTLKELKAALDKGEIKREDLTGFDCKAELFIQDKEGKRLFSSYFGNSETIQDICDLLGIKYSLE